MNEKHSAEEEVKADICKTMGALYRRNLICSTGGNVSARMPGTEEFWITPSGIFKGELSSSDVVKVDLEGGIIEGNKKPSIEVPMHRAIYKKRLDVNAIVHAHNPVTVGLASVGMEIQSITVDVAFVLKKVPIVPFALPGTEDLANAVVEHIVGSKALILKSHGVVGVGSNLLEAKAAVEKLEEVSIAQSVAYHFGKPRPIPKKYIERAKKLYE
jgi:L-ribulose-5-phosphate 4-epimerase